ncbi:MAG TPA: hypothetical protein VFV99_03780 [Kofleriaceae bacterium]|nr:hypothetical protein [Kofleriaceae bacterium]
MRITVGLAVLALASCAKTPAEHTVARPIDATQVVIAPDKASPPPAAPAPAPAPAATDDKQCVIAINTLMRDIAGTYAAMDSATPHKKAVEAWPAVPATCRNGRWYLAAALLIDAGDKDLTAGTIKVASEEAALTSALAQPDDIDVLVRVGLVNGLGRGPKLPADACDRAKAAVAGSTKGDDADKAAYVCARAAIAANDGKAAGQLLASLKVPKLFVDSELARAQAAKLAKDSKTTKAQAKLAMKLDSTRVAAAKVSEADRKAIIAAAKQLAAGK